MFAKLLAVTFLSLPFVRFALAEACARSYTVKEGDICDSISAANNVSTYQLATINAGIIDSSCSNLQIGQSICLGYGGNEDCKATYVVVADDTCEGIATTFGINTTILSENNPNIDIQTCSNIYTGEVLCVATSVQVPPAAASFLAPSSTLASIAPTTVPAPSSTLAFIATTAVATTSSAPAASATSTFDEDDEDGEDCDSSSVEVSHAATSSAPAATTTSTPDDEEDDEDCDSSSVEVSHAAASSPPAPTSTSTSTSDDEDEDDEDCESSSVEASFVATTSSVHTSVTPSASATSSAPAASTTSTSDDEDDGDLPFCDEL